ncbi:MULTISPECIES: hypothetical protein [Streptomyces]|uniref:Uncharacterized protein n=1 Tax=Streptomyces cinereoruber TaxID=67260 RepID=A0ABX6BQU5_9ACTN|nr:MULTISPECIES: hypothetical protein [Streptomyces]AVH94030.1 hypothetical protein C5L38_02245 [Streptomyces sp. WAC00288]KYG51546.1 hypothetical protein AWI43_29480 [Streptomyces sp. WAC04657]MBB4161226.1 hypothetical protein [Streptomyces cinereoruber]MBY8819659.1 hypothetical protein [Streptomyces cinereoruber]NIH63604.1 hypothetical protein [Streptomyces cinereoruber]
MDFAHSPTAREYIDRVGGFTASHVLPCEQGYRTAPRLADGPDEGHLDAATRAESGRYRTRGAA